MFRHIYMTARLMSYYKSRRRRMRRVNALRGASTELDLLSPHAEKTASKTQLSLPSDDPSPGQENGRPISHQGFHHPLPIYIGTRQRRAVTLRHAARSRVQRPRDLGVVLTV